MDNPFTKLNLFAYHHSEYSGIRPDMEPHSHNTLELYYVIDGQVEIFYMPQQGSSAETITLYPKDFALIRPNVYHSINTHTENLKVYNLELTVNAAPPRNNCFEYLATNAYVNQFPVAISILEKWKDILVFSDTQNTAHILRKFKNYPEKNSDPYFAANLEIDLKRLFIEVIQCSQENIVTSGYNVYVRKAIKFIETNYRRDITVKNVADDLGISASHLQRIFKQAYGKTILGFLNEVRINKAKQLIIDTNMSIAEISENIGFNSTQAFNARFKDFVGLSPVNFRKNETHKRVRYKNIFG